jgi:hypothetical protein
MGAASHERVVAEGKMWWQSPGRGILGTTWRPGWLYLTAAQLLWWSDFDRRIEVDIPLGKLRSINVEPRALDGILNGAGGPDLRDVLVIASGRNGDRAVNVFAGEVLPQWRRQIKEQVLDYGADLDDGDPE